MEDYIRTATSHREDLNEVEYVKEILPGKIEEVYDIGVDDIHCFYANGILVHNCFMGMATKNWQTADYGYMPRDRYFSHEIGKRLYNAALNGEAPIGLDIKVLVSLTEGLNAEQIVVAAPMIPENEAVAKQFIADIVHEVLSDHHHTCDELLINGTGSYVIHSSVGDAGVVGRKLAVDFYGLNCPIGGGATYGKDATKADVTLNLAARYFALKELLNNPERNTVYCKIACCIGKSKCLVAYSGDDHKVFRQETVDIIPSEIINWFKLDGTGRDDMFFWLCKEGLFSYVDVLACEVYGVKNQIAH